MTMSEYPNPYWGNLLKSNSNGTYFGLSLKNVNRDERGLVDFEKMIGLDGIAVVNIVANTEEAAITGYKSLQTRITHNDGMMNGSTVFVCRLNHIIGSTWKPLTPPSLDSMRQKYDCDRAVCHLYLSLRATWLTSSVRVARYKFTAILSGQIHGRLTARPPLLA